MNITGYLVVHFTDGGFVKLDISGTAKTGLYDRELIAQLLKEIGYRLERRDEQ